VDDDRSFRYGFFSVLLIGVLFSATTIAYVYCRVTPLMPPLLPIPPFDYYRVQLFYEIPAFVIGWLLAASVSQIVGLALGAKGGFKQQCSLLGFALNVPWIITWIVDSVIAVLYLTNALSQATWTQLIEESLFWRVFNLLYGFSPIVWVFALLFIESRFVRGLSRFRSTVSTVITVVVVQLFMMALIR
jgi:hypothetical protein